MLPLDDGALLRLLKEDVPYDDLTTRSLGIGDMPGVLCMRARGPMTVCGSEEAARIFTLLGATAEVLTPSGSRAEAGQLLARVEGRAESLHTGWKVAQTLTEWASGIATSAAAIVEAARAVEPSVTVACTRKAAPGTRARSLRAIVAGGAQIHRTGLSDTVLLFAEHRAFGGQDAIRTQIARLRGNCPERRIVVEVATPDEALRAAEAGADVLQLEKFTSEDAAATAASLADWPGCLAVAGGINARNAARFAETGAGVLVTSAPYYANPADVAVTIERCGDAT